MGVNNYSDWRLASHCLHLTESVHRCQDAPILQTVKQRLGALTPFAELVGRESGLSLHSPHQITLSTTRVPRSCLEHTGVGAGVVCGSRSLRLWVWPPPPSPRGLISSPAKRGIMTKPEEWTARKDHRDEARSQSGATRVCSHAHWTTCQIYTIF